MASRVTLWDPFVRLFHWSLAAAFLLNRFLTEAGESVHEWLGYAAVGLVALRVVWGFAATGAARWDHFWPTRSRLAAHLRELRAGQPHRQLGHSPLGAVVMIAMMLGIVLLGVTGFAMQEIDYFWGDERLNVLHAWLADAVLVLAAVHVMAAVLQSLWLRENLPLSMVTGRRRAAIPRAKYD
jgi:cytochrome b